MIDYLIVGLGFSGAAFSRELEKRNIDYRIVDPCSGDSSTFISGGLINPVSGRKYNLQWNIPTLAQKVEQEYHALEKKLNTKLLFEHTIFKIHKSAAAREEWLIKKDRPEIQPYISNDLLPHHLEPLLDFSEGFILVKGAYHIDTANFMNRYIAYLENENRLIREIFNYDDLILYEEYAAWKNQQFRHVIFCEGIQAMQNPYFNWVPFTPSKGECMLVEVPGLQTDLILQKNIHLIPIGDHLFWAGSTNSWNDLSAQPTHAGYHELKLALDQLLKVPNTIVAHKAGIRPTIRDRAPVVGAHPAIKNLYMLNGMGTKGASLSNYYAAELFEHITEGKPISREANINRFFAHFK